jgi:putative SOS response-associated peptidase YedK
MPNLEPREDIRITDRAPILRWAGDAAELVQRRWSWPGAGGKPVYNFRSDGREFGSGRCLIVTDGFYEFTTPTEPRPDKRKDKWLSPWPATTGSASPVCGAPRRTWARLSPCSPPAGTGHRPLSQPPGGRGPA